MSLPLDELLQTLLSAERAGVQVASASLRECQDPELRPLQTIANAALQASRNGGAEAAAASVLAAPRD